MRPVYGSLLGELNSLRGLGGLAGESYVDKDLRTLLDPASVNGPFNLRYCGNGSLDACRASLWTAFDQALTSLITAQGTNPAVVARLGVAYGFHARPSPRHVPVHEPADLPTSDRVGQPEPRPPDATGSLNRRTS